MKINVTAATGQLGSKVVEALLARGVDAGDLVASVRTPSKASALADDGVEVRQADYRDGEQLARAFWGSDVLLLISSMAPPVERVAELENTLHAAEEAGVRRIVLSGFAAATSESKFSIAPYWLYAECRLRQTGADWTILRNGMYLDPVADWIPELAERGCLPYPVRDGRVAFVGRDDLARATAAACVDDGHGGRIYELTGPEALSMPQLAEAISRAAGRSIEFRSVTDDEFVEICREGGESPEMARVLVSLYRAVENGELEGVTNHIEWLTGEAPISVDDFLASRQRSTL